MSYSFSVRGASRIALIENVGAKLDEVVAGQPMHKHDRDQALASTKAFVEILPEPKAGQELMVSVHGSVGWMDHGAEGDVELTSAGVGVSVGFVPVQQ